ncbi:hypothetical protein AGMMS50276_30400 [Synergistales bacterium]|nr:hypothetical protein AGMMS50276_30400 [Synergistales bacterium]
MKIAILARSNKRQHNNDYGCCVAGITEQGKWIRLVADERGDSLPDSVRTPNVCTVIEANIIYAPLKYQIENAVLINWAEVRNEKIGDFVNKLFQPDERYLFGTQSNRLGPTEMNKSNGSLRLIQVNELEIYKSNSNSWKTKFKYAGSYYEGISMTDPKHYSTGEIGTAIIVVSLPNDDGGYSGYYKFVAAIYPK